MGRVVDGLALLGVLLAGLYLLGLALLSFIAPALAQRFLLGFAGSAATHGLELALRIVAGGAFVIRAPLMMFPEAFSLFGWGLILTSACLLALPWRWHQRFAQRAVPLALRGLGAVAMVSLAMGGFVIGSALGPLA